MSGTASRLGAVDESTNVLITVNRQVAPLRTADQRFNLGITMTHDTFPSGAMRETVANVKELIAALAPDYLNMFSHQFGQQGPCTNADRTAGLTYTDRAAWSGWRAWDRRLAHLRDCAPDARVVITLLPPGWCRMDGGHPSDPARDPLGAGRTWDNLDGDDRARHTDAHRADMVDIARAIAERHPAVTDFAVISEQKGNFMPPQYPAEIASDGLTNIANYQEQARYQRALSAAVSQRVIGPYLVLEGSGADDLAVKYGEQGFPQPAAAVSLADNSYRSYHATAGPLTAAPQDRARAFLEGWFANTSEEARHGVLAADWKVLATDNDPDNWTLFFPHRWRWFESVRAALRQVREWFPTLDLVGMESYFRKVQDNRNVPSDAEQGAMAAEMVRIELEEGVAAHFRWAPEQGRSKPNRCNLFTSTSRSVADGGGQPHPAYFAYKLFADHFRGVDIYAATSSDPERVTAVATPTHLLLINHTPDSQSVSANGTVVTLTPYEVKVVEPH